VWVVSLAGEVSLLLNCPHTATVTTTSPCVFLQFQREDFEAFTTRNPSALAEFRIRHMGFAAKLRDLLLYDRGRQAFEKHIEA
jgi:CRP-like cAMP-binding protein